MSTAYQDAVMADAPSLYWRLDMVGAAVNGDAIPDISGNSLDGTLVYGGTSPTTPYGHTSPIETDAASRAFFSHNAPFTSAATISRASAAGIAPSGDITVEAWLKPEVLAVRMIAKESSLIPGGHDWIVGIDANGRFYFQVIDTALTSWVVTAPGFGGGQNELLDEWWHVVGVRFGNALFIAVSGAQRALTTVTSLLGTLSENTTFRVSAGISGDFNYYVDEVAIYDHALSTARILVHYEAALLTLTMRGQADIRTTAQINGAVEPDPVGYPFRHNWSEPVIERFRWRSSVFKPTDGATDLARQRSAPRRQIEYSHLLYSEDLRRRWEARAFGGRTAAVQFEPDKVQVAALLTGATTATFSTVYLDFEVGHRVLFYVDDDTFEYATLTVVTDTGITWDTPLTRDYTNVWVKPARVARLPIEQEFDLVTDIYGDSSIIYDYLEEDEPLNPRRITPWTSTLTYRSREMFDLREWQGHDYSEIPTITYVADRSQVDEETGVVAEKQYRWGAEMAQPYNMNLQGRALIAKYLGWVYERAGQYSPFWMPTFRQDLKPVSAVTVDLTVSGHEYTQLYAPSDTRIDLAFVYFDNTVITRRIDSSVASGSNDVLTLDAAVPTFTNLRWLSFLRRVILSSDDVEIAWETDNVVRVAFAVVDAPLDFLLGSPSPSPSLSLSTSLSPSPSHSTSSSTSPSASTSPSHSASPSV